MTTTHTFKDVAASVVTSAYKWLTATLYAAQQGFAVRPFFTCQVIDDLIQPLAQWYSGGGLPLGQGSMATAPDGTVFAVGLDGSNVLKVFRAQNLNAVSGNWPLSTALSTGGDNFLDSRNEYSISISDAYNGMYRICVWYFANFINDGTNLTIKLHYSDDGGLTFNKLNLAPASLPNNSIGNLSIASMKPVFLNGAMNMGCFYIKPNASTFSSGFTGYDVYYIYGTSGGYTTDVKWYQNANSYDWTIHSLSAFYLNGVQYCVLSGFRNILDSIGINPNYSIWVTGLLNITKSSASDLWTQPISVMPVGSASSLNQNSFTFPSATVQNGMMYITMKAVTVDSVSNSSQGPSVQIVTTHTNYMIIQSDDGQSFSYPGVLVGTDGTEFNSSSYASFVYQNGYWYLGGALGYLWQLIQNNIVADVSADVIAYNISETAGQPSAISVQIGNQNNKWVGSAPTGPGAAAIAKNRKIAVWQGFYNANGVTEAVPHSVYYIDDIQQTVTSTQNDITLIGRDFFKKLKTTVTKFSYQFLGPTFFSDIFDGTFMGSWNQISGTWNFLGNITPPLLELGARGGGAEDNIMLANANSNSYGHLMRIFFRNTGNDKAYIYGFYFDSSNWLRLELNCTDGQSWAVVRNLNGTPSTLDSGTMPFTMSAVGSNYYGVFVRRYDYFKFTFMIEGLTPDAEGNSIVDYDPATVSYVFKNSGTGEYDLSATFAGNASYQKSFTVGFGSKASGGPIDWRWFMFTTFNASNDLGLLMRKIARIAGIFAFKITYTWRELLFTPSITGTYTLRNRALIVAAGNRILSNTNSMSNGEVSFRAKIAVANNANPAGFSFVFRYTASGTSGQPDWYKLHLIQASTGFANPPVFSRFERFVTAFAKTYNFYNSGYDVSNNPVTVGSLNIDLTQWHTYRIKMIDGWFYAFVDDVMVASWIDNNSFLNYLTTGPWGFEADTNTTLTVKEIVSPNFWKPVQAFSFNPGDDAESAIDSLIVSLRAWFFSDLLGRFKAVFLGSTDPSTYTYNAQLFQQNVDASDKEYVSQVTVYGSGVSATARNTNLMPGVPTRDAVVVDYTILNYQDAQTRANNELINANQYRNQYTPKQVINVGAELFDAVTIVNTGNNTSGVNGPTRVYSETFQEGGGNNNSDYSLELSTGNL